MTELDEMPAHVKWPAAAATAGGCCVALRAADSNPPAAWPMASATSRTASAVFMSGARESWVAGGVCR